VGKIRGIIESVVTGTSEFKIKEVFGIAGIDGVVPTDFDVSTSPVSIITATEGFDLETITDKIVLLQMIKKRTFIPAVTRTFQPYVNRTFTPPIYGEKGFRPIYSRYGLLHVNKYRLLVNVNGLLVVGITKEGNEGFIHVPEFYSTVIIKQNGHMNIKYIDGTTEYVGQISLVTFPNKYGLNIWSGSGYEIRCNGAGGFGTALGSWCKNTGLEGKMMWYYVDTIESGTPELRYPAAFSQMRLQQYHLNTKMRDLYLSGEEPHEIW
jgi:hypothetical protein